jgi:serine/threonine-protein kinase
LLLLLLLVALGGMAYAFTQGISFTQGIFAPKAEVPNLVGAASIEEAQQKAGDKFRVAEGNRVESKEAVGTVVKQNPEAGTERSEGSTIYVDVSGTQVADLPDVKGKTSEEAQQALKDAGFEVDVKSKESSAQEKNYVIDQDPQGGKGATAEVGSSVTITVGDGPANVKVPDLYNLTPERAKQTLEAAGLSLGNQTQAPNDKVPKGQIVDQQPAAGKEAKPGSSVDVVVSSGPKQIPVPNVVGSSVEDAVQALWNAGFGYTVETVQSNQPAGTVVATDPGAGTLLDPSSRSVTVSQSAGPPPPSPPPANNSKSSSSSSSSSSKGDGK